MKIYTKTGDKGETSLYGGKRVSKLDIRIEAYGTIDELNSFIGLLKDQSIADAHKDFLFNVQHKLFTIGAIMATPIESDKLKIERITENDIEALEREIDNMDDSLERMTHFILPGGHKSVSYCHVCRSVCRRAERRAYELTTEEGLENVVLKYLNRLSDYLFVLARMLTKELNVEETKWIPSK